jgi:hypothetical protein
MNPTYRVALVADLKPHPQNPRRHGAAELEALDKSVRRFGFTSPIIVQKKTGLVLAGHARLEVLQRQGVAEVPVVELDIDDKDAVAYMIADNQLTILGSWDFQMLEGLVADLKVSEYPGMDLIEGLDLPGFESPEADMPDLASGDKEPFQQMTFTLHDSQAEQVKAAMEVARGMGPFVDSPNENGNGNALARICETFLTQNRAAHA